MANDPQHNLKENDLGLFQQKISSRSPEAPAPTAEVLPSLPEKTAESAEVKTQPEAKVKKEGFLEETIEGLKNKLRSQKKKPVRIPQVKDAITVEVEHIMEDGIKDAFRELTPIQQEQFKIKGEETAWKIRELLRAAHIKVKKIFQLLLEWLKMLPGINHFFLEQEAKIKTDKILTLKERK